MINILLIMSNKSYSKKAKINPISNLLPNPNLAINKLINMSVGLYASI